MFKQIILYKAVCDGCGEHFENSGCETHPPYFTQDEVKSFGQNDILAGSWEFANGKLYCPDCYEREVIDKGIDI